MRLRRNAGRIASTLIAALVLACAASIGAQSLEAPALSHETTRAVREIDDPSTHMQWLLVRDASSRGGPGRLVLALAGKEQSSKLGQSPVIMAPLPVVIRSGDRLIVEDVTPNAEARLEAVALGPAVVGAAFEARLAVGGRSVKVIAAGAGRAVLARLGEVKP